MRKALLPIISIFLVVAMVGTAVLSIGLFSGIEWAEIFSFLKFGQPGAILLSDGDVLMSHWYADQGQYKTVATRISL